MNSYIAATLKNYERGPDTTCAVCCVMLYEVDVRWIENNTWHAHRTRRALNENWPLNNGEWPARQYFRNVVLRTRDNGVRSEEVAVCEHCKSIQVHYPVIPQQCPVDMRQLTPYERRQLSPIYVYCSQSNNRNGPTHHPGYVHIHGITSISYNLAAIQQYSGLIGSFNSGRVENEDLFYSTQQWLIENNAIYRNMYLLQNDHRGSLQNSINMFPMMRRVFRNHDNETINIQTQHFPEETSEEDYNFWRLPIAGFGDSVNHYQQLYLPGTEELEGLLFPTLFPQGIVNHALDNNARRMTLAKRAKYLLMHRDRRWAEDSNWIFYSFMTIEKQRIHSNRIRTVNISDYNPQMWESYYRQSNYSAAMIVNEHTTHGIPDSVRSGPTYWKRRLLDATTILNRTNARSTVFFTLSSSEHTWTDLHTVLNRIPSTETDHHRRPVDIACHYTHRFHVFKKRILKHELRKYTGPIVDIIDRHEFQDRGSPHTHGLMTFNCTTEELISKNFITCEIPDDLETRELVYKFQMHRHIYAKCGQHEGSLERCSKGFPYPLSDVTKCNDKGVYSYRRQNEAERWVSPYNKEMLLAWRANINVQYCTTHSVKKYVLKYIVKEEPTDLYENNSNEYFMNRTMSTVEASMHLLSKKISEMSTQVKYIDLKPPGKRMISLRPHNQVNRWEPYPFYKHIIEKYYDRPQILENLTIEQFYEQYELRKNTNAPPSTALYENNRIYKINNEYYVIPRKTVIYVRAYSGKGGDLEDYFFGKLMQRFAYRTDAEILNGFSSYYERYMHEFPDETHFSFNSSGSGIPLPSLNITLQCMQETVQLIRQQIVSMESNNNVDGPVFRPTPSQYITYNNLWLSTDRLHFVTGAPGTGKTYLLQAIRTRLERSGIVFKTLVHTNQLAKKLGCQTLHSYFKWTRDDLRSYLLPVQKDEVKQVKIYLIDECGVLSGETLDALDSTLRWIHQNNLPFGGNKIWMFGDLFQLAPINGRYIFESQLFSLFCWHVLRDSCRQTQEIWIRVLGKIRIGNLDNEVRETLLGRLRESDVLSTDPMMTTALFALRVDCDLYNSTISDSIPELATTLYSVDSEPITPYISKSCFNLKQKLILKIGSRVMCTMKVPGTSLINGSIGIITKIEREFVSIIHQENNQWFESKILRILQKYYSQTGVITRLQFPICDAFAMTVHKCQGLTINNTIVRIDETMFAKGHAYVALSRTPLLENITLTAINFEKLLPDPMIVDLYRQHNAL